MIDNQDYISCGALIFEIYHKSFEDVLPKSVADNYSTYIYKQMRRLNITESTDVQDIFYTQNINAIYAKLSKMFKMDQMSKSPTCAYTKHKYLNDAYHNPYERAKNLTIASNLNQDMREGCAYNTTAITCIYDKGKVPIPTHYGTFHLPAEYAEFILRHKAYDKQIAPREATYFINQIEYYLEVADLNRYVELQEIAELVKTRACNALTQSKGNYNELADINRFLYFNFSNDKYIGDLLNIRSQNTNEILKKIQHYISTAKTLEGYNSKSEKQLQAITTKLQCALEISKNSSTCTAAKE